MINVFSDAELRFQALMGEPSCAAALAELGTDDALRDAFYAGIAFIDHPDYKVCRNCGTMMDNSDQCCHDPECQRQAELNMMDQHADYLMQFEREQ